MSKNIKDMLGDFIWDIRFALANIFGKIEMCLVRVLNNDYFEDLSIEDIPKDTFYCYSGCRCCGFPCPYSDYSRAVEFILDYGSSKYCHYAKNEFGDALLYDQCKICGVSEFGENE